MRKLHLNKINGAVSEIFSRRNNILFEVQKGKFKILVQSWPSTTLLNLGVDELKLR